MIKDNDSRTGRSEGSDGPSGKEHPPTDLFGSNVEQIDPQNQLARLNAELFTQKKEMEALMEVVPTAILISHDPECRAITANRAASSMFGLTEGDGTVNSGTSPGGWSRIGRFFREGKELALEELPMQEAARKGQAVSDFDLEVLLPTGKRIKILGNARPLLDAGGGVTGLICSFIDITQSRLAEARVQESEAKFKTLFESSPEPVSIYEMVRNEDGHIIDWIMRDNNPVAQRNLGRSFESVTGKRMSELYGADYMEKFIGVSNEIMASGEGHHTKAYFEWKDRFYLLSMFPIGKDLLVAMGLDITDRKLAEDQVKESEVKYRGLFENIKEAVSLRRFIYDEQGEIIDAVLIDANPAALEIYGASTLDELRGKRFSEMASPEMTVSALRVVKRMRASGKAITEEEHSDINGRDYLVTAAPFGEDQVITTSIDITARKMAEDQLRRSNADLQQFAYVASHDLKEPLRMVTSYLQLLEKVNDGKWDGNSEEYIRFAVEGASRMKTMVEDLLAYSRIDTRSTPFAPVDMESVMSTVLKDLRVSIDESGATIDHDHLPTITADKGQMVKLLENLVGNAIKFRGDAPPTVLVSATMRGSEWLFSVEDNGIGVDQKYADRLFQMFQRLHDREDYPGTGIGLAIAKKIVEHHGGRIWFESEGGKGTTFFFTIPHRTRK